MMAFLNLLFAAKQVSSSKVEGWPSMTRRQFISVSLAAVALPWVPSESVPQVKSLVEGFPLLKTPQHFYLSIDGHTGKSDFNQRFQLPTGSLKASQGKITIEGLVELTIHHAVTITGLTLYNSKGEWIIRASLGDFSRWKSLCLLSGDTVRLQDITLNLEST